MEDKHGNTLEIGDQVFVNVKNKNSKENNYIAEVFFDNDENEMALIILNSTIIYDVPASWITKL